VKGFVSLIGAGPGDPELLTLRGLQRIREAEMIAYDHLSSAQLLQYAPPDAEIIYVGKKGHECGRHWTQERICQLLVDAGASGRRVARLKGGDPFIFGRGGEEALALAAAGIAYEIVPGVSSISSVPAYAGIPITHRGIASSVTILTGHFAADAVDASHDWAKIATGADTLVFLMAMRRLPLIVERLIFHGRSPNTPSAVTQWGSTAKQRVETAPLKDLPMVAARLQPPGVVVIGEVAALRDHLDWFSPPPVVLTEVRA
jgi:uroporphyrinogen III methyltransferase/synthase